MTAPDAAPGASLPAAFGRYTLLDLLGAGGMGKVFRAELRSLSGFRKQLAIKLLHADPARRADSAAFTLFEQEARLGGLLRHPNVIDVYDFGFEGHHPWIAMEWVEGASLAELVRPDRPMPISVALDAGAQICAGLAHAHALEVDGKPIGLVHRDLKPANVLVDRHGDLKITDFGLARASAGLGTQEWSGAMRGTPSYLSPEQATGKPLDARSDIFSFGLLLWELLTGERFFKADTVFAIIYAIVEVEQALPRLQELEALAPGRGLPDLVARCLATDPDARWPSASVLGEAIRQVLRSLPPGPDLQSWVAAVVAGADVVDPAIEATLEVGRPAAAIAGWPPPGSAPGAATPSAGAVQTAGVTRSPYDTMSSGRTQSPTLADRARLTNLGTDADSFVGREKDLQQLADLVTDGARMVTLLGPGGAGKTRLAREYARARLSPGAGRSAVRSFAAEGGVWFCDLTAATSAQGILHEVGRVLQAPLPEGLAGDEAIDRLGWAIAERGLCLLLLDNFEQVIDAAEETLARWVDLAPEALFLVTSRERLRVPGERVLDLGPLDDDDALQLFEERARAVSSDLQLSAQDREHILEVVRRLDCIPLAIELAAARLAVLSPKDILDRLGDRFGLLRSGRGGRGGRSSRNLKGSRGRQATLLATIDWSWQLLETGEQEALAQCAVFAGSFSLEAAEEVLDLGGLTDAPWVLDALEALRDKSLLRTFRPSGNRGSTRFGMYESIRAFARNKLSGERPDGAPSLESLERRHALWMLKHGERWAEGQDQRGDAADREQLSAIIEDLALALRRHVGRDPDIVARAALCIDTALRYSGPFAARKGFLEEALAATATATDRLQARLMLAHDQALRRVSRGSVAFASMQETLKKAEQTNDPRLLGEVHRNLADFLMHSGRTEESQHHAQRAVELAEALGDPEEKALAASKVALLKDYEGKPEEAVHLHRAVLADLRRLGLLRAAAYELNVLAIAAATAHDVDEAERLFTEALELNRQVGHRLGEAMLTGNLGLLYAQRGEFQKAERFLHRGMRMHASVGDRRITGLAGISLVAVLMLTGQRSQALDKLNEAIELVSIGENKVYLGIALRHRAALHQLEGRFPEAQVDYVEAQRCMDTNPHEVGIVGTVRGCLAAVLADQDKLVEAREVLAEADRLLPTGASAFMERLFLQYCTGHLTLCEARRARATGDGVAAARLLKDAKVALMMGEDLIKTYLEVTIRLQRLLLRQAIEKFEAAG